MAKKLSKLAERVRALEDAVAKLLSGGGKVKSKKARRKTAKKAKAKKSSKKRSAKPAKRTGQAASRPKQPRAAKPEPDLLFQEPPPTMY
jgi:hypothetical protein